MIDAITHQVLLALPLILGAYISLSLLKLPDFSLESAYLFGAVSAYLAKEMPLPLILVSAIGGGMVVGSTVAIFSQILRLPFLLSAIITNGIYHGFIQYLLGTSMKSFSLSLPIPEYTLFAIVSAILLVLAASLGRSQLGYSWAIYGNNPQFFQHNGLRGSYVASSGIILAHGYAGISGFLFAQANGFVDLTMNFGIILLCLTALILGKLFLKAPRPNFLIPVLGILAFFMIQQGLLRVGLNLKYFNAFQALCILLVLYCGHKKQTLTMDHLGV